jgi:hypothetical protein
MEDLGRGPRAGPPRLDLRLTDLPGTEFALRIHDRSPGVRIPVLFVSGWVDAVNAATRTRTKTLAPLSYSSASSLLPRYCSTGSSRVEW